MASSKVVLPPWKGPTRATQRGPVARVPLPPFPAMLTSRGDTSVAARSPETIVSGVGGAGQEARHRAPGRAVSKARRCWPRRSACKMKLQRSDTGGDVEADLTLDRQRLQRDRTVGAAD